MRLASPVPPVIDEIRSGARSRRSNNRTEVSTWSRSSSGRARCRKRYSSKPLPTPLPSTSPCRLMRMWSALRLAVATHNPSSASPALAAATGPSAPAGTPAFPPSGAGWPSTCPVRDIVSELLELVGGLRPQPGAGHDLDRLPSEAAGGRRAQLPRPGRLQAIAQRLHRRGVAGLGPKEGPEPAPFGRQHGGVANDDWVGDLPATQVAVARLPGQRRLAPDAQPVVANLEGEPQSWPGPCAGRKPAGSGAAPRAPGPGTAPRSPPGQREPGPGPPAAVGLDAAPAPA